MVEKTSASPSRRIWKRLPNGPSGLKLHNGQGKYLFKKALQPILPAAVLQRPKQGFAIPMAEWLRGELKEFAHQAILGRPDGILNDGFLGRCWTEHQRARRDWSPLLWSVLMFRTWQEVYKGA